MPSLDFLILVSGLGLAALSIYLFSTAVFTNNTDAEALARREGRWSEMQAAAAMGLLAGRAAPPQPSS